MNYKIAAIRANMKLILALLVVMLLTFILGCENSVSTKRGSVSGIVTDLSNNAIVGAVITSHRSLFKAETDENGHYEFTSLDVGSHRLAVARNGYYLASKTVEITYGQVVEGINIKVEPLENMISHSLSIRESNRAIIDVSCREPMSIVVGWRERSGGRIQAAPTEVLSQHRLVLSNLFAGSEYLFDIEGVTEDGRRFAGQGGSFRTVPFGDLPGDPAPVSSFKVSQGTSGTILTWGYEGVDPLRGFRVFRALNNDELSLYQDENTIFAAQNSFVDENAVPGKVYRYAIRSVDLDGNVSPLSDAIRITPAGKITENIVWKKDWSPFNIGGDMIVPSGLSLQIEPGCVIRFNAEDKGRTGYSQAICEFIVEGTLLVEGTESEPVHLISAASLPGKSDWDGIRLVPSSENAESVLRHVVISGADEALAVYDSSVAIANVTTRFCLTGVSLHGASGTTILNVNANDCETAFKAENSKYCTLENFVAENCNNGILLESNIGFLVKNFEIRDARLEGLKVVDRLAPRLRNGLISSSGTGLTIGGASGDFQYLTIDALNGIVVDGADVPVIRNCIIVNRQFFGRGSGIQDKSGSRSYPYNNIYGFLQATLDCDQLGGPVLNLDPVFVGGTAEYYDYHLRSSSPLLSASENGGQTGAYGSEI